MRSSMGCTSKATAMHETSFPLLLAATHSSMGFWYTFLGVSTAVAQVVLNLSPVPDISRVHPIGELAALPLVAMVVNCHFWLVYAYVTDSMFPLFATQVFGQLAAIVYNAVYYNCSTLQKREELRRLYTWAFAMHCALSLYTVLGLLGATYQSASEVGTCLGYVGIVIDVWMFASPLGTLKHVVSTKSAASIPINLSLMLFVSTSLWVVSGLVDRDYFVAGLNGIGSLLSIVQIVFYMIYRPRGDEVDQEEGDAGEESVVVVTPSTKTTHAAAHLQSPVFKLLSSPTVLRTHQHTDSSPGADESQN